MNSSPDHRGWTYSLNATDISNALGNQNSGTYTIHCSAMVNSINATADLSVKVFKTFTYVTTAVISKIGSDGASTPANLTNLSPDDDYLIELAIAGGSTNFTFDTKVFSMPGSAKSLQDVLNRKEIQEGIYIDKQTIKLAVNQRLILPFMPITIQAKGKKVVSGEVVYAKPVKI